jgi:hypothetical protein
LNRIIRETNKARQVLQTRAYPELSKLVHRRDSALQRQLLCQQAYAQMRAQMLGVFGKACDYPYILFSLLFVFLFLFSNFCAAASFFLLNLYTIAP